MRKNSAMIVWACTVLFIVAAGCISLGDNGPGATSQAPSTTTATNPGSPAASSSLTEAQKTQAANIAKGDSGVKEILGKSGYGITGVFAGGAGTGNAVIAVVYIEGGDTLHSDGSIWTPDMYEVTVDVSNNKVTGTKHFAPKSLPTPAPAH
jgi:hypothetical protein